MDSCVIPQLGYGEFSDWLHKRVGDQRIPIAGSLEVTMRCNLRCQHCYIPLEQRADRVEPEMSKAEIQRILDEITDAGCLWLLLTGGDPFLRSDFLDIYLYAKRKGLLLNIFTNGTLITPKIADFLADWRPFGMEITLYGATKETYERVTGIPGSYERCRRGIELLLKRNLPLKLKTMVMTLNQHELGQMQALAANYGLNFRFDPILHTALDSSHRPNAFRLSPEEIVAIEKGDPERSRLWPHRINTALQTPTGDRRVFLCGAGKLGFHIDAIGRLCLCISARDPFYDLRSGTFQEGWEKFIPSVINRQYTSDFECINCNLRTSCPQCAVTATLENGVSDKPTPFLCQIAHLRKESFVE